MKYNIGDKVWISAGHDSPGSYPMVVEIADYDEESNTYTVFYYEDRYRGITELSELEIYPDKQALMDIYAKSLDAAEKEFEEEKAAAIDELEK